MSGGDSSMHSPETIEKMKEFQQNKTQEHKDNISKACTGVTKIFDKDIKRARKQVHQLNNNLEIINTFNSIADAAKSLETSATQKTKSSRIGECCNSKRLSAYGFT
jgi:hypothetical protein